MNTTVSEGFADRIRRLVEVAGSQRRLADIIQFTDVTIGGWLAGSQPYEKTLTEIARRTGISLDWLKSGHGDEETELQKVRAQGAASLTDSAETYRVREVSPDMECPYQTAPASGTARHLEIAAETMDAEKLAGLIARILTDRSTTLADRNATASRL